MGLTLRHLFVKCKNCMKWWGSKLIKADTYNYYKTRKYNNGLKGGPI